MDMNFPMSRPIIRVINVDRIRSPLPSPLTFHLVSNKDSTSFLYQPNFHFSRSQRPLSDKPHHPHLPSLEPELPPCISLLFLFYFVVFNDQVQVLIEMQQIFSANFPFFKHPSRPVQPAPAPGPASLGAYPVSAQLPSGGQVKLEAHAPPKKIPTLIPQKAEENRGSSTSPEHNDYDKGGEGDDPTLCVICYEKPKQFAFQCGHLVCEDHSKLTTCPFCKKPVVTRIKIFL